MSDATPSSTVTVSAVGRASAPPDVVRVDLAASALRPAVAAALAASEQAVTAIRSVLATAGVAPVDAATVGMSIMAEQVWGEQVGPRTVGYRSEHRLALTLRDMSTAPRLLGEILAAGGDDVRLDGVAFEVEDAAGLRRWARAAAWAQAEADGRQLAELSGRRLGPAAAITDQGGSVPIPMRRSAASIGGPEGGHPVGLEPGVVAAEVTLAVQFSLVEPD